MPSKSSSRNPSPAVRTVRSTAEKIKRACTERNRVGDLGGAMDDLKRVVRHRLTKGKATKLEILTAAREYITHLENLLGTPEHAEVNQEVPQHPGNAVVQQTAQVPWQFFAQLSNEQPMFPADPSYGFVSQNPEYLQPAPMDPCYFYYNPYR